MMAELHQEAAREVPYDQIKTSMYRWKHEANPPEVHSLEELGEHLRGNPWANRLTYSLRSSLTVHTVKIRGSTSIVFFNPDHLSHFHDAKQMIFDMEIKATPHIGNERSHMLTVFFPHIGRLFPAVWAVMECKCPECFDEVLSSFKQYFPNVELILGNYKPAMRVGSRRAFPGVQYRGRAVEYVRDIVHKLCNIDRSRESWTPEVEEFQKKIIALTYLPHAFIADAYNGLVATCSIETQATLRHFLTHFERKWINWVKPINFSVYNATHRVRNDAEVHNKMFVDRLADHPAPWDFVEHVTDAAECSHSDFNLLQRSGQPRRTKRVKTMIAEHLILKLWTSLDLEKVTVAEFLEQMGNLHEDLIRQFEFDEGRNNPRVPQPHHVPAAERSDDDTENVSDLELSGESVGYGNSDDDIENMAGDPNGARDMAVENNEQDDNNEMAEEEEQEDENDFDEGVAVEPTFHASDVADMNDNEDMDEDSFDGDVSDLEEEFEQMETDEEIIDLTGDVDDEENVMTEGEDPLMDDVNAQAAPGENDDVPVMADDNAQAGAGENDDVPTMDDVNAQAGPGENEDDLMIADPNVNEEEMACYVCWERVRVVALMGCNMLLLCHECLRNMLISANDRENDDGTRNEQFGVWACPACRETFETFIVINTSQMNTPEERDSLCVLCRQRKKSVINGTCTHFMLCTECDNNNTNCLKCGAEMSDRIIVTMPGV